MEGWRVDVIGAMRRETKRGTREGERERENLLHISRPERGGFRDL